jgi:serine/threonine protein kinase, bacterial
MPLADGQVYAGYTILRKLGEGGMGMVYLAQHPRLPRCDALKVLPAALTVDNEYRQRFDREAYIASTLWHPHIVEVHDRGELEGRLWISMDYVDGTDAASRLETRYPNGMPPDEVVRIARAVAEALDYAHDQQFLHRDVKPSNILLSHPEEPTQRIFLADFGIAKFVDDSRRLTATNMAVGTVAYAAPEQLMGEHMDGRADQYALAATVFHLLTGTQVFQHTNPAVVISQHLSTPPPAIGTRRPDLRDLGPVFSKALAKSPGDRYRTCVEFADALATQLGIVADKSGADDDTAVAIPTTGSRHRARPQRASREPTKTQMRILVALLVTVTIIALVLLVLHLI